MWYPEQQLAGQPALESLVPGPEYHRHDNGPDRRQGKEEISVSCTVMEEDEDNEQAGDKHKKNIEIEIEVNDEVYAEVCDEVCEEVYEEASVESHNEAYAAFVEEESG